MSYTHIYALHVAARAGERQSVNHPVYKQHKHGTARLYDLQCLMETTQVPGM